MTNAGQNNISNSENGTESEQVPELQKMVDDLTCETAVHNAQIDELIAEQDLYQNVFTEHSLQNGGLKNHERLGKSEKVPDPPILTDGKDLKFKDWYIEMKNKLQANTDWYDTD